MPPENMLWLISSLFLAVISLLRAVDGPQRVGATVIGIAMVAQSVAIVAGLEKLAMLLGTVGVGIVFILFVAELLWKRRSDRNLKD